MVGFLVLLTLKEAFERTEKFWMQCLQSASGNSQMGIVGGRYMNKLLRKTPHSALVAESFGEPGGFVQSLGGDEKQFRELLCF